MSSIKKQPPLSPHCHHGSPYRARHLHRCWNRRRARLHRKRMGEDFEEISNAMTTGVKNLPMMWLMGGDENAENDNNIKNNQNDRNEEQLQRDDIIQSQRDANYDDDNQEEEGDVRGRGEQVELQHHHHEVDMVSGADDGINLSPRTLRFLYRKEKDADNNQDSNRTASRRIRSGASAVSSSFFWGNEEETNENSSFEQSQGSSSSCNSSVDSRNGWKAVPFVSLDVKRQDRRKSNMNENKNDALGKPHSEGSSSVAFGSTWEFTETTSSHSSAIEEMEDFFILRASTTTTTTTTATTKLGISDSIRSKIEEDEEENSTISETGTAQDEDETDDQSYGSPDPNKAGASKYPRWNVPSTITIVIDTHTAETREEDNEDGVGSSGTTRVQLLSDPTEPLRHGQMGSSQPLEMIEIADRFNDILQSIHNCANDSDKRQEHSEVACDWIRRHPEVCQVQYRFKKGKHSQHDNSKSARRWLYPLSHFCAVRCLSGVQAAYEAFPESIGFFEKETGDTPLHEACKPESDSKIELDVDNTQHDIVAFLVDHFPEIVRVTNQQHQTALHLLCQGCTNNTSRWQTLNKLLEHYPTAMQLADSRGYIPLHCLCNRSPSQSAFDDTEETGTIRWLDALAPRGYLAPAINTTVGAVTRDMEKNLHLAAASGASTSVLRWIVQRDRNQARWTDSNFRTPLHRAVQRYAEVLEDVASIFEVAMEGVPEFDNILLLIRAFPEAKEWTDVDEETPYDVALRSDLPMVVRQVLSLD